MDRGIFGLALSLASVGTVIFSMVMARREGQIFPMAQSPNSPGLERTREASSDPVEEALARLRLVWAAMDGVVDEDEILRIARRWQGEAVDRVLPQLRDWAREIQEGRGERLVEETLASLLRQSEPVRLRVLEELSRMAAETGPLREEAMRLVTLWGRRLLVAVTTGWWQLANP